MKVIIDSFEGDYAIVEYEEGKCIDVPKVLFPNSRVGDVITIQKDDEETRIRSEHTKELINKLFKKGE